MNLTTWNWSQEDKGSSILMAAYEDINNYKDSRPDDQILVAKLLLRAGANPWYFDKSGASPLDVIMYKQWSLDVRPQLIKDLVEAWGGDIDRLRPDGVSHLMKAVKHGTLMNVNFYLESGANPKIKSRDGKNSFDHLAESCSDEEIGKYNDKESLLATCKAKLKLLSEAAVNFKD